MVHGVLQNRQEPKNVVEYYFVPEIKQNLRQGNVPFFLYGMTLYCLSLSVQYISGLGETLVWNNLPDSIIGL